MALVAATLLPLVDEKINPSPLVKYNLDMIAETDWVIDLGEGGRIVQTGTPAQLMKNRNSHTGKFLKKFLDTRGKE